jgi:hypothetical protein
MNDQHKNHPAEPSHPIKSKDIIHCSFKPLAIRGFALYQYITDTLDQRQLGFLDSKEKSLEET